MYRVDISSADDLCEHAHTFTRACMQSTVPGAPPGAAPPRAPQAEAAAGRVPAFPHQRSCSRGDTRDGRGGRGGRGGWCRSCGALAGRRRRIITIVWRVLFVIKFGFGRGGGLVECTKRKHVETRGRGLVGFIYLNEHATAFFCIVFNSLFVCRVRCFAYVIGTCLSSPFSFVSLPLHDCQVPLLIAMTKAYERHVHAAQYCQNADL